MELIGSLFLVLALGLLVTLFIARPFYRGDPALELDTLSEGQEREHQRSSLLAERDRILTALQELDFDYALGKVPGEDYPEQRAELLNAGADILRRLDALQPETRSAGSVEDRIEQAVAARRADAAHHQVDTVQAGAQTAPASLNKNAHADPLEDVIAARKRQREEKTAGFCPRCGRPVQKSDKFCSRCGATL